MAGTPCLVVASRGVSRTFGSSTFWSLGDSAGEESATSTEAQMQYKVRSPGTYTNLDFIVSANTLTTNTAVIQSRKNTANGNLSVSVTHGVTGEFSDLAHSDSVAATDLYCVKYSDTAAAGAATVFTMAFTFTPTSGAVKKFLAGMNTIVAGTTSFIPIAGANANTTESKAQIKSELAGTLSNYVINVRALSAGGTNSTAGTRIAGVNGNLTVSITVATTGQFEDTAHTDSVSVGNLINQVATCNAASGAMGGESMGADFTAAAGNSWYAVSGYVVSGASTLAANTNQFFAIGGGTGAGAGNTTESFVNIMSNLAFTAANLGVNIQANSITAASTCSLRQNGNTTALSASITASTTGIFEDLTHKVTIAPADKINHLLAIPNSGTTMVMSNIVFVATTFYPLEQLIVNQAVKTAAYH